MSESKTLVLGSRNPPVGSLKDQYLFLLELYVNYMSGERLAKLNGMFFVPTSITFEFLQFTKKDNIEVTPVDPMFHPQAGIADEVEYFYAGRSIMFAIDQESVTNKVLHFILKMSVRKKMPEGIKPDIAVGVATLDLSRIFAALRKEMLQCWQLKTPPPKTYEGDVPLVYLRRQVGTVNLFVRMSAFGQTIVTEFDAPPVEKSPSSFIFKSETPFSKALIYNCRKIDSKTADMFQDSNDCLNEETNDYQFCYPCGKPGALGDSGKTRKGNISFELQQRTGINPKKSKSLTCADPPVQGGAIKNIRGIGQPCGKAVVLKVSGLLDTGESRKTPTVTVAPESEATGPNNPDPDHDVFILRIGKKGLVGVGEKSDIQLEMRTPKSERGLPVRLETREMQTEDENEKKKAKKKKKKNGQNH